jgi:hypothetical protein
MSLEGPKCLDVPARSVQRKHQLGAKPFVQWIIVGKRLEFAVQGRVTTALGLGIDAVADGCDLNILESHDLRKQRSLFFKVCVRRSVPECQCLAQHLESSGRVAPEKFCSGGAKSVNGEVIPGQGLGEGSTAGIRFRAQLPIRRLLQSGRCSSNRSRVVT